jgi:hypothetical protein
LNRKHLGNYENIRNGKLGNNIDIQKSTERNSMTKRELEDFKDGTADGLLNGNQDEKNANKHYYKQGYDFGIALYGQLEEDE